MVQFIALGVVTLGAGLRSAGAVDAWLKAQNMDAQRPQSISRVGAGVTPARRRAQRKVVAMLRPQFTVSY